jgi:hypothetical protein
VPHWGRGGSSWGMIAGTMVAKRGHGASLGKWWLSGGMVPHWGHGGVAQWGHGASLGTWWLIVGHDSWDHGG